jgi:predicted  nucleic acid-binding Zn-ribbon protein
MGFFREAFELFQDVTSLGGTARMRHWQGQYQELTETYQRLCTQISERNQEFVAAVARIKKQIRISTKHLRYARKMLDPFGEYDPAVRPRKGLSLYSSSSPHQSALVSGRNQGTKDELMPTLAGAGSGAAGALASWNVVQVAGHASTGAAMAGLHGAAAANAGWAWFGGGSLATGGGGMAAGHFILPGIGTAIAVTVSATLSHKKANRLAEACKALEGANTANQKSIKKLDADLTKVTDLEFKLDDEAERLWNVIRSTRRELFRYGMISRLFRFIRYWFRGYYYLPEELRLINNLDKSVLSFISKFETI